MTKHISVAIFGLGRAGKIHLKNLAANPRVVISYIVDMDTDKCIAVSEEFNLKETKILPASSYIEAFSNKELQAVLICTPTNQHEHLVKSAIEYKKAVFCEKPVSENIEITEALYDLAQANNTLLFCAFNRRFDPSVKALHERVSIKSIGKVHVIKTCSRDNPVPSLDYLKISGGIFHDCAVHDIDMVCWLLGEWPSVVFTMAVCNSAQIQELNDVDTVLISMQFDSGAIASIDLSRHGVYGYDQRVEVFGSNGMLVSENQRPTELVQYSVSGESRDPLKHSFPQRYQESYVNAMQYFLQAVESNLNMSVISKSVAVNVSRIATACEQSYRSKKPIYLTDLLK